MSNLTRTKSGLNLFQNLSQKKIMSGKLHIDRTANIGAGLGVENHIKNCVLSTIIHKKHWNSSTIKSMH